LQRCPNKTSNIANCENADVSNYYAKSQEAAEQKRNSNCDDNHLSVNWSNHLGKIGTVDGSKLGYNLA
jgi:hypothetical protein